MPQSRIDRAFKLLAWPAALYIAYILLWYEQYKLTGDEGSVWLFQILADWLHIHDYEKPFRLGVASAEIVASLLVLVPRTRLFGGALALGLMSGAIFFHTVSPLGIDPYQDGGVLFHEACEVWLCAAFVLVAYRREGFALIERVIGRRLFTRASEGV
jgi:hypothetical protein